MKLLPHLFFFAFMFLHTGAMAFEMPFDRKTFDELRAAEKPVVIHVHAHWCGTCKKQAGIATSILAESEFNELILMRADYDNEDVLRKELHVSTPSTFVIFKGKTEVGRSRGDTSKERIVSLFRKAL